MHSTFQYPGVFYDGIRTWSSHAQPSMHSTFQYPGVWGANLCVQTCSPLICHRSAKWSSIDHMSVGTPEALIAASSSGDTFFASLLIRTDAKPAMTPGSTPFFLAI